MRDKQIRPLPCFAIKLTASGEANSPKTHKSPSFSLFSSSTNIKILPFAALIGSIACFNQWRKKNYYLITKSSGISLWRILSPTLVSFFLLGFFSITILSPFSTLLNKKYENLQTLFFGKLNVQGFSFDTKGLWIKQLSKQNYLIINANKKAFKVIEEKLTNML